MNVVIFEHLLCEQLTGHEVWLQVLARGFVNTYGDSVTIVGHQSLSTDVQSVIGKEFSYAAEFKSHMWEGMTLPFNQEFTQKRRQVATDISRVIEKYADADLHVFPTAFPTTALGIVSANRRAPQSSLLFHHSHDERLDGRLLESAVILRGLQKLSTSSVSCLAQNPSLAAEFAELGVSCRTAPYPFFGELPDGPRQGPLRRIGIMGHQRDDKDNGLLLPLINALLAEGFLVTYHNSKGAPCVLEHEGLTKIERHLSPTDFAEQIASCDAVIITNPQNAHVKRISGVCLDALSSAVPVIVPQKTHMSRMVNRGDAGVCYEERSVVSILRAVKRAERNYAALGSNAFQAGKWLHRTGGYDRLVESLRGGARV